MQAIPRLKEIITDRGIKYTTIAAKTGISVDALSKAFRGKRRMSADEMISICNAVGVTPNELLEEETNNG